MIFRVDIYATSEVKRPDEGLSLNDVMALVSQSRAQNKIIILDSCFSGNIANPTEMPHYSLLHNGTTILAACGEDEYAMLKNIKMMSGCLESS